MKNKFLLSAMTVSLFSAAAFAEDAAEETKGPEVAFSGEVEMDAYTGDLFNDDKVTHDYASTLDLNIDVKFNEKWSASVQLEADGASTDPGAVYNGAFIQYTHSEKLLVKAGDLTFSEGAFLNYYGYDDPADNAAGMSEHDIRGVEVDYSGIVFGLGFGRGDNDNQVCVEEDGEESCVGTAYDAHLAYDLTLGEQVLRPFVDYKSYQEAKYNELHAGLDANLKFGAFALHAVYGLHSDYLGEDEPKSTHAFLAEPSFETERFSVKASAFYAIVDNDDPTVHGEEIPEYMFGYVEPGFKVLETLALGIPLEYHTNTLNDDEKLESVAGGVRVYFTPVEGLDVTSFAMLTKPFGDDYSDNDDNVGLNLGVEAVYAF